MPAKRATGADEAGTRTRLIEATARIIREEGYAAATSRRVAAAAGVKSALVYYYFPTMDDLYVAVMRDGGDKALDRMRQALTADDPLQVLWEINTDARFAQLNTEFMALANHRKAVGAELKAYAERVRDIETAAVTFVLRSHGVDLGRYPPIVVSMLLTGAARILCNEGAVGMRQGHTELRAFVEELMGHYGPATSAEGAG
ncbi:AcrR family transcriptional regulator [Nocardia transvalensis]|uniref:AcrR family transcriptional regulator n=1 Tax=Nocardia transvalensis TaxID=37333 RepID=A0A7W9UKY0_9NOCA|nr:TetR/AcrR family transcriptional regulator [Nocardia transvalensis]MBB5916080.1 AcrR family transcriptional regulator [Nocardia transvalensis]